MRGKTPTAVLLVVIAAAGCGVTTRTSRYPDYLPVQPGLTTAETQLKLCEGVLSAPFRLVLNDTKDGNGRAAAHVARVFEGRLNGYQRRAFTSVVSQTGPLIREGINPNDYTSPAITSALTTSCAQTQLH